MRKVKSLLNKISSPMRPPAGLGDLLLTKSFVSKVFSLFITTQSAEDSRQRRSGMTALFDVKAFTLVELLVVVLIIGVLSAIAIPMYQGAVDKSHWSTMLPGVKALKDAEEAIRMSNGLYTSNMENLDVRMPNGDVQYTLETVNDDGTANVVRATNSKLGDKVRLSNYLDENTFFGGQLHCEALKNDERANRLCGKLLMGQNLKETDDGYTRYLLDQSIDKATCNHVNLKWSSNSNRCYQTAQERCDDNNGSYTGGMCNYGRKDNTTLEDGEICDASSGWSPTNCNNSVFNAGSVCKGGASYTCKEGTFDNAKAENCGYISCTGTFTNGSTCEGNGQVSCHGSFTSGSVCVAGHYYACSNSHGVESSFDGEGTICVGNSGQSCNAVFSNGAVCIANASNTCSGVGGNTGSGCCCGDYCRANTRCADSVCNRADIAAYITHQ